MSTTTDFFSKCLPAIRTNVATSGLMTVCNADVPVPGDLDTIFKNGSAYRIMEALFMYELELNANNVEQTPLSKYFLANKVDMSRRLSSEQINSGLLRIRPYILAKRKGPVNNNYWIGQSGAKCLVDGTLDAAGTYWSMSFTSPTSIPVDVRWFSAKMRVFVKGLANDGTAIDWAGEVVTSTVVGSAVVTVMNPQVAGSYLPAARKANPVSGLVVRGTPNVSDFESFCAQPPGLITSTEDPFWIETTRTTFKEDELYNQWRDLIFANNPLYRELYDLDTIAYNKQVGEDFTRRNVETLLRNKPRTNQTISTVNLLEDINTIAGSTGGARCVGKRANAIGFYEQHVECERVVDLQGQKLNIPALIQALYKMSRVRESAGAAKDAVFTFEIGMTSTYAVRFHQAMLRYYDAQWGGKVNWNMEIKRNQTAPMGFKYSEYELVWPEGMKIRVVTDRYFDDYASAMKAMGTATGNVAYENLGRQLWIMDFSRMYMGVFGSERKVNTPGKDLLAQQNMGIIDPCVIRTVSETNTLTSFTWTGVVECLQGNLIIENISDDVPEHDVLVGDYDENS